MAGGAFNLQGNDMSFVPEVNLREPNPSVMIAPLTSRRELESVRPFAQFDAALSIEFDQEASDALGKDHWRVLETFKFYYGVNDSLRWAVVPAGFLTDGASVPRMFWGVIAPWGPWGQAAALHDYLLEYKVAYHKNERTLVTRDDADRFFGEALKVTKMPRWKRWLMYAGVRLWTKFGWNRPSTAFLDTKHALEAKWVLEHQPVQERPLAA